MKEQGRARQQHRYDSPDFPFPVYNDPGAKNSYMSDWKKYEDLKYRSDPLPDHDTVAPLEVGLRALG